MSESEQPANLNLMKTKAWQDQNTETLRTLAAMAGAYFRELLAQGFERDEAHAMVQQWQDAVLAHVRPKSQ